MKPQLHKKGALRHTQTHQIPLSVLTVILGVLQAVTFLSIDLYLPAFPAMAREFDVPIGTIEWSLSIFLIGMAVGQAVYGPLVDRYGRRKPLLVGLVLFALGACLCAVSEHATILLLGRFLQAMGGAAGPVASIAMVRDLWKGKEAAIRFSMQMMVSGVAPIAVPPLGGLLLTHFPWQVVFWGLAVLGVVLLAVVFFLPETSKAEDRQSVRLRDALTGYLLHLRNLPFVFYLLTGALLSGVMFAYITSSSFVYIKMLGITPAQYGLVFGLNALGFVLGAQLNRRLLKRFSLLQMARGAVLLNVTVSGLLVLLTVSEQGGVGLYTLLFFGLAFSCGSSRPNLPSLGFEHIKARLGSAAALQGIFQYVLGGLMGSVVGWLSGEQILPVVLVMAAGSLLALLVWWQAGRVSRTSRQPG